MNIYYKKPEIRLQSTRDVKQIQVNNRKNENQEPICPISQKAICNSSHLVQVFYCENSNEVLHGPLYVSKDSLLNNKYNNGDIEDPITLTAIDLSITTNGVINGYLFTETSWKKLLSNGKDIFNRDLESAPAQLITSSYRGSNGPNLIESTIENSIGYLYNRLTSIQQNQFQTLLYDTYFNMYAPSISCVLFRCFITSPNVSMQLFQTGTTGVCTIAIPSLMYQCTRAPNVENDFNEVRSFAQNIYTFSYGLGYLTNSLICPSWLPLTDPYTQVTFCCCQAILNRILADSREF